MIRFHYFTLLNVVLLVKYLNICFFWFHYVISNNWCDLQFISFSIYPISLEVQSHQSFGDYQSIVNGLSCCVSPISIFFFLLFFFLSFLFFLVKHHHVPGRSINRLLLCFWSSSKFLCSLSGVFRICWLTCSRAKADHFSIWSRWNTDLTFEKIMECIDVQICCKMRSQPFFSRTRLHIPYMHIYPLWDGRQKSVASTTHHRDRPNSTKSPRCQVDRVLERSEVLRGPLVSGTRCVFFGRGAFLLTLEDFMLHECRGLLDDLNPLAELHVVL